MADPTASSNRYPLMHNGEIFTDPNRTYNHPPRDHLEPTWPRRYTESAKKTTSKKKKTPSKLKMTSSSEEETIRPLGSV